jgi:hypothetical protein
MGKKSVRYWGTTVPPSQKGPVRAAPLARRARTQKQNRRGGSVVRNRGRAVFGRDGPETGNEVGVSPLRLAPLLPLGRRESRTVRRAVSSSPRRRGGCEFGGYGTAAVTGNEVGASPFALLPQLLPLFQLPR